MSEDIKLLIGQRLRLLRKIKGYSQERIGEFINVSYQQVQKYEAGMNRISADDIWRIANELKMSPLSFYPESLYGETNEISLINNPEPLYLMQMFQGMYPEMRKAFIHIGESMVTAFPLSAKVEAIREG